MLLRKVLFITAICINAVPVFSQSLPNQIFNSVRQEDIQWIPYAPLGEGAFAAFVVGTPSNPGPYIIRVKATAGVKLMPHTHPEDRVYTVISGVFYIGLGSTFDSTKLVAYGAGSVIVLPRNTPHFHYAKSGEYVTQIYGTGPFGTTYINPADDPRKK
jgi:quercetin dioxygenase-like cupin family protein